MEGCFLHLGYQCIFVLVDILALVLALLHYPENLVAYCEGVGHGELHFHLYFKLNQTKTYVIFADHVVMECIITFFHALLERNGVSEF